MSTEAERPEPIEGQEFPSSTRKALNLLAGGFFLTGISLLVVGMWAGWWDLFGRVPYTWFAIVAAIVGLFGPILIVASIMMLIRKRRAVIGTDRFQFIDKRGGMDTVVAQFLYANAADFLPVSEEGVKSLKVRLHDRDAAGTFDKVLAIHHGEPDGSFDFVIEDHFQGRIEDLASVLEAAVEEWREKHNPE